MRPLLFLVADKNMEYMLKGFFGRENWHLSLGCGAFDFDARRDILVAAGQNDPGLFERAGALLGSLHRRYRHVVVMVDADWDGSPGAARIANRLARHITDAGWPAADGLGLVLDPELEQWVWSRTPHVAQALGWSSLDELWTALEASDWLAKGAPKPARPKEAVEWALDRAGKPRSSAIYQKIAARLSLKRCTDPSLSLLLDALQRWYPPG